MIKNVFLFLVVLAVVSCSLPENLGLPTWTTTLQMYILNDTYEIADLAEEDSMLVAFGDTLGFYETMNESGEIEFSTDEVYEEDSTEIGEIEINNPDPVDTEVPLSEIAPSLINGFIPAPGIDPFTLPSIIKDDIEPFGEFEQAAFISGTLEMSLTNNTVIWMGNVNNGEPLVIDILDLNDNIIIQHVFTEDIPPNAAATITETENLAGVIMENEIKVELNGGSRGTDGAAATVNIDDFVEIDIAVNNLIASEVIAQIPSQDISDETYVTLDEDITIYEAIVADNGYDLTIDMANAVDLEITVDLSIDNVWLAGETDPFHLQLVLPPSNGGVANLSEIIDLNGASMGDGTVPLDSLHVVVEAFTTDTGDEYRTVNANDFFEVNITVSDLEFAYLSGILQPREQDEITGSSEIEIDYPFINGTFELVGYSEIIFNLFSPVPAEMEIDIASYNSDGDVVYLREFGTNDLPIIEIPQGNSEIIINTDDYNINELISILPDSISYVIYPTVGDTDEIFEYTQGDSILADIEIESQLDLVADCWLIPTDENGNPDVQSVDVKDFEQKHIDAFQHAILTMTYNNSLGMDTAAKILISEQRTEEFIELTNPDTTLFKIIDVPLLSQTTTTPGQIQIEVLQTDLEYFVADSVFIVPKIQLLSDEGMSLSGSIHLNAKVEVEFEINSELTD
ncbi:MAG: hypothetical protein K9N39_11015 [Candidatus Cloacimonetes bacterium]|nr:hypothetical protein [Candidatus Cloacimonadota bacterium]MCF7814921.1 hypothetical protein [Candidatus Cloacimonadota bacterium]